MNEYISAKLVGYTQPAEDFKQHFNDAKDLIAYCGRVSNPSNQMNTNTSDKLINYLIKHKHWSPFEMASATIEIKTTRDIARQLLRHRSFAFQEFCIDGNSKIKTDSGQFKIKDLYQLQKDGQALGCAKVYDEVTRLFTYAPIKEVFSTGVKPVYQLTLLNGRKIKSTMEHKFLTKEGFKTLSELKIGDKVGINGVPCYQNADWLLNTKTTSIDNGGGLTYIAQQAGVTTHTIRKWLKAHSLQFTKKEVSSYNPIWNKGLESWLQPKYGKVCSDETREKMRIGSASGEDSQFWKGGVVRPTRQQVYDWQYKYRNKIMKENGEVCASCGAIDNLQVDHIKPVKQFPELAYDFNNLQVLCRTCHFKKSLNEQHTSPNYSAVKSIEYIGEVQTFDMEVDHKSHNYVANGICTHNSQRYADPVKELKFVLREARLQDHKNRQNSIETSDQPLQDAWNEMQQNVIDNAVRAYKWAVDNGIAKEQARCVLPEGNTMSSLYVQGTIRSFIHYIEVRTDQSTQKEHRLLAQKVAEAVNKIFNVV